MKAWRIDLDDCTTVYVLAPTRDKATARAMKEHPEGSWWWGELDWKRVRRRRMPELDGDGLTHQALCAADLMWDECAGCGARIQGREATPNRYWPQWEETPGVKLGDPGWMRPRARYLEEITTPVWTDPFTPFCCQACADDHPERVTLRTAYKPTDAVLLTTEDS